MKPHIVWISRLGVWVCYGDGYYGASADLALSWQWWREVSI